MLVKKRLDKKVLMESIKILPIDRYLPQQRPFILVDKICVGSEKKCVTQFVVYDDCVTVSDGELTEGGLLENLAQTCAAHIGFVEIHIRKSNKINIGLVAAVKQCEIHRKVCVGEMLTTEAEEKFVFDNMSSYNVVAKVDDEVIARGEMQVVLSDSPF